MNVTIIAEAGVNHNGDIEIAKQMILKAKEVGADYIKFQTFIPEKIVSRNAQKANYQKKNTCSNESQLSMLKKLALSFEDFLELKAYSDRVGIGFVSTPFDFDSIEFLNHFDMDFWKIPSGEITNLPYLEKIGKTLKRVILSTGMSEMNEIRNAIEILEQNGCRDITLLHCSTEYPVPFVDVNLLAMNTIKNSFNKRVGYSDHTQGIEVSIAAVALGASVIEKHFTLDKNMIGPDHKASIEPEELALLVRSIRNIELALGDENKKVSKSEERNILIARKSIVAKKKINIGDHLSEENLTVKRPGNGISPMRWYDVIGRIAAKEFYEDELIIEEGIE